VGESKGVISFIEHLLTVWIEDWNKKCIPLSRAAIQTKSLNMFKRVEERYSGKEGTFNASVHWFD
jgi:hypothetical protein